MAVLSELKSLRGYYFCNTHPKPFQVCIIQVGIVDSCPRLFNIRLNKIIKRIHPARYLHAKLNRMGWPIRRFGKPWVSISDFSATVGNIHKVANQISKRVIFVAIAPPAHNLRRNCGNFSDSVLLYNDALAKISGSDFLDVYANNPVDKMLLPDGHHLSNFGHQSIANAVLRNVHPPSLAPSQE